MGTIAVAEAGQALMVHKTDPQLDRLFALACKHLEAAASWLVFGDRLMVSSGSLKRPEAFTVPTVIPDARDLGVGCSSPGRSTVSTA
jgi:hypothetical protein